MKYIYMFFLSLIGLPSLHAQDKVWVSSQNYAPNTDPRFGLSGLKFTADSVDIIHVLPQDMSLIDFRSPNCSITDSLDNLLFYTNGLAIFNAKHDTMQNAKGFNNGIYIDDNDKVFNVAQTVLALPHPTLNYLYYLFHSVPEIYQTNALQPNNLKYSVIDMRLDSGRGAVVEKNVPIINDWICRGYITACKHANGKDWWILTPKVQQGAYYRTLFTGDSIYPPVKQLIGPAGTKFQSGFARFSQDGTLYFLHDDTNAANSKIQIYDFDRCTGLLSNLRILDIPVISQEWLYGISISPNSRYLYINSFSRIFQYDLKSSDILASQQVVANYDGYVCTFPPDPQTFGQAGFLWSQIGPDDKIYICSPAGGTNVYHVIDYPDSAGLACDVRQHAIQFPTFMDLSIPNFPNYRLGASATPCYGVSKEEGIGNKEITVYPNPATQRIYIETTSMQGKGELLIYNALGQVVYSKKAVFSEGETEIYIGDLPKGAYYLRVVGEKGAFYGKFFKE